MRRRQFISLLGGAATWPLVAHAQQSERMRRIGVLGVLDNDDPEAKARVAAFQQALAGSGWTEGVNVQIDFRWAGGDLDRVRKYAAELVALGPDVILAEGSPVGPLLQSTARNIPIVFTNVVDPVGSGFVASMSHPGGNATGFTQFEYRLSGKWLELLREVAPNVTRVAVIRDPRLGGGIGQFAVIQAGARGGRAGSHQRRQLGRNRARDECICAFAERRADCDVRLNSIQPGHHHVAGSASPVAGCLSFPLLGTGRWVDLLRPELDRAVPARSRLH